MTMRGGRRESTATAFLGSAKQRENLTVLTDTLEAGYVWVNDIGRNFDGATFGGTKNSGIGREESRYELDSFTQTKTVTIRLGVFDH